MKTRSFWVLGLMGIVSLASVWAADKHPYKLDGTFVEGCSCKQPCAAAFISFDPGCKWIGAMAISAGSYQGGDLAGVKLAMVQGAEKWVRIYLDVPNKKQHAAAEAFARAYLTDFGMVEAVKDAKVEITGNAGKFTVKVDDGKILQFASEPVLGRDKKTPVTHANVLDPVLTTYSQGKTLSADFKDDKRSFKLEDSNAFYNDRMNCSGEL